MAAPLDKTLCVVAAVIGLNIFIAIGTYLTSINDKLKYRLLVVQWLFHFQSALFFIARYVWIKICPPLFRSRSVFDRLLMFAVATILVFSQCCVFTGIILAGEEPSLITILSYICFGITILIAVTTFVTDLFLWCLSWFRITLVSHLHRTSQTRVKILIILIISGILTLYGIQNASRSPSINRLTIRIKDLPKEFKGFSVVHLSDIHVGSTVGRSQLEQIVKTCNSLRPDAVVITGDLIDSTVYQIRQAVKPLLRIKAKHGLYFVTGKLVLLYYLFIIF